MVVPALRPAVRRALRQAIAERRTVAVELKLTQGGAEGVLITAHLSSVRAHPDTFRVSFEPVVSPASRPVRAPIRTQVSLRSEVGATDELLEGELSGIATRAPGDVEAFEATHEELKASNEEVTSINEELQSTNEELETARKSCNRSTRNSQPSIRSSNGKDLGARGHDQ